MGISVIGAAASSGGGGTNNFVLKTTAETTYVLDRTYTSGRYSLSFLDSDSTFDIYAIAEDGTYAGYTASTILEVSADFAEVVVLGAANGTRISFTHLGVITESVTSGDVATAGAFVSSVVTSSLPSVDDTTVVNGGNFAANVAVSFIDQSAVEVAAKTVVRSSSTQLLITRPDAFLPSDSPFTVKVVNPGIPVPTGTNAHLLSNSVTAGTNPVWTTSTAVPYNVGGATNYTFLATDTEATDIDYSVVSGTLPAGLALDGETGVLSGTASGAPAEGDVTAITIRAIDAGGNFLDKAFDLTANVAPTWTTATGALDPAPGEGVAYSFQLVASTGSAGGALTYTLQSGALLAGHSLSSTGLISGTASGVTGDAGTFTIRVTDEGGLFVDRSFTTTIILPYTQVTRLQYSNTPAGSMSYGMAGSAGIEKFTSVKNQGTDYYYSTDALPGNWSGPYTGPSNFGEATFNRPEQTTRAVNSFYYGSSNSQPFRYTNDGVTWSNTSAFFPVNAAIGPFRGFVVNASSYGGYWHEYYWFTQNNGSSWTQRSSNNGIRQYGMAATDGTGTSKVIISTQNSLNGVYGVTYYNTIDDGPTFIPLNGNLTLLAGGNGMFMGLMGTDLSMSSNGSTWTTIAPFTFTQINSVTFAAGRFIVQGRIDGAHAIVTSADGITWAYDHQISGDLGGGKTSSYHTGNSTLGVFSEGVASFYTTAIINF
jgi:hypothetical protein